MEFFSSSQWIGGTPFNGGNALGKRFEQGRELGDKYSVNTEK